MKDENLKKLIELGRKISVLKASECRIMHERVSIDRISALPVMLKFPENTYRRIGFCTDEARDARINCAHSTAHIKLRAALDLLAAQDADAPDLQDEFNDLMNCIYLLDHEKGEAEKKLAVLIENKYKNRPEFDENEMRAAKSDIKKIEKRHGKFVRRIGEIREIVLSKIQTATGENLLK